MEYAEVRAELAVFSPLIAAPTERWWINAELNLKFTPLERGREKVVVKQKEGEEVSRWTVFKNEWNKEKSEDFEKHPNVKKY